MTNQNEQRIQKHFVKDGDDDYMPRRPIRRISGMPSQPYKKCECGGKLRPRGALNAIGHSSVKCNKCGKRVHTQHYKGILGLVECC